MDPGLSHWSLGALLCCLLLRSARGTAGDDATNGTVLSGFGKDGGIPFKESATDVLLSLREKLDETKAMARNAGASEEDAFLDNKPWGVAKAKASPKKPPRKSLASILLSSAAPTVQASGVPATERSTEDRPTGMTTVSTESSTCVGCGRNGKPPSRSLLSERNGGNVEPFGWPDGQGTVDLEFRKSLVKGEKTESQEDSGSGDPHGKMRPAQVTDSSSLKTEWDLGERITPLQTTTPGSGSPPMLSTEKAISPDSAEIDHLLEVSREANLQPPSPSGTEPRGHGGGFEAGRPRGPLRVSKVTERRDDLSSSSVPPEGPLRPSPSDLIDVDYNDPSDIDALWHKPLHYDDFSPFDDSYFYPTPSFYAEYEEGGIEDEDDDDEDLEEAEDLDDDITPKEVGNGLKAPTQTPKVRTVMVNQKPTGGRDVLLPGELPPNFHPEGNRDLTHTMPGTGENSTECRTGYVRRNNSCKSLCEIYPTYCYNGGQCYLVENTGAFCRCNTQDYIWHKGLRCESIITDFQVMCVAVGTAALVVLLLFMMTVFFAKKLYLLKTENYKLRKRNRYRTPSELHNDNFSLSTIAEGSHPNVRKLCDAPCNPSPHARALAYYDNVICQEDPNASQKVQDLPKACLKDEEPFNIQNTLSPKLESGKGDSDIVDVNCVLNNLT